MIKLSDKIAITADENQYIVGRPAERRDRAGKASIEIARPRYYATLSSAVKSAVSTAMREMVADGTITTLHGFIAEQQRIQNELAMLLEPTEPA